MAAHLQAAIPDEFELQEIEVTGVHSFYRTDSCEVVARLTHDELTRLPITGIADILACLPNIDVRSRGAGNAQTDVSMRGGTFDQVALLLNGVPLQDAQTGHYAMNIPVATALIERIEVLQGIDITGALTGAINIVTRDAENDTYTLEMSTGTNSYIQPSFTGSWSRKDARINTAVDFARSDGYYAPQANAKEQEALRNTDYRMANIYLQTRWRGLDVQAGAQYKDAGLGTGYGYASMDQFDATRTCFASGHYTYGVDNWQLRTLVAYRGQYDRYEWHRGTVTNRHWTHNTQAALEAQYHWRNAYTLFGVAFKDEYIRSTNMGEHNRWQTTLHAKQHFRWNRITASLSAAAHYNSWSGWYGSGAAHADYKFDHARGAVYIDANRSLRMPTWTDMYYKAGVQRGNTALKAEKAWQIAVGGQYNRQWKEAGSLHLNANAYYRWGQDIIDWTFNETDSLFYATNQHAVNAFGVDVVADYQYNAWLRHLTLRYAYTYMNIDLAKTKSQYLDYLRHKLTLHINHALYVWSSGCIGADWSLRWQDRAGTFVDINGTSGNAFTPVLLLDGSIYMEIAHVRASIECRNMTNRHYYDYGGVLMPGTSGRLRIACNF